MKSAFSPTSGSRAHQSTVRRHYVQWRLAQDPPLPERCDNDKCRFHTEPLVWNGSPFTPILDHKNGVNSDNRPDNPQFLCPNCDAQQKTRGGANKGRVEKSEGGFAVIDAGIRHYQLPAEIGHYQLGGDPVVVERSPWSDQSKKPRR
jgi:hypothetical protein